MAILKIADLKSTEMIPGFHMRMSCLKDTMFSHWTIEAGAELPEHFHIHEQISILTEGTFEFTLEGETQTIQPGMVIMIPSNAKHSGKAITKCTIIDVFSPVREDYVAKVNGHD